MRTNKRVSAVIINQGRIVLIHRFKNGDEYFVVPGGGVEDNDHSLEDALRREIKEELSVNLTTCKLIFEAKVGELTNYSYLCEVDSLDFKISGPESADSSANNIYIPEWVAIDNLKTLHVYPADILEILSDSIIR